MGGSEIGLRVGASEQRAWQDDVCRAKVQLWEQEGLRLDPHPPRLGDEHPLTPTSCQAQLGQPAHLASLFNGPAVGPLPGDGHMGLQGCGRKSCLDFPSLTWLPERKQLRRLSGTCGGWRASPSGGRAGRGRLGRLGSADERPGPAWEVGRVFNRLTFSEPFPTTLLWEGKSF